MKDGAVADGEGCAVEGGADGRSKGRSGGRVRGEWVGLEFREKA